MKLLITLVAFTFFFLSSLSAQQNSIFYKPAVTIDNTKISSETYGSLKLESNLISKKSFAASIDYMKRGRNQNAAGWLLVVCGSLTLLGGVIDYFSKGVFEANQQSPAVYIVGGALIATGVVFFISSAKNKKRAAAAVSLKNEQIRGQQTVYVRNHTYPTLSLRITL